MKKKTTIIGIAAVIFAAAMFSIAAFAANPADTVKSISKPCRVAAVCEPDPNFHST